MQRNVTFRSDKISEMQNNISKSRFLDERLNLMIIFVL